MVNCYVGMMYDDGMMVWIVCDVLGWIVLWMMDLVGVDLVVMINYLYVGGGDVVWG